MGDFMGKALCEFPFNKLFLFVQANTLNPEAVAGT